MHVCVSGRRRGRAPRPRTPILEQKEIPPLELPDSSEDLLVPNEELLNAVSIYEVLRNFSTVLRLSPFRFEDFCATHMSLLKAILREEDNSNTTFGPADLKDSVNSTLFFIDGMTWPEVLRSFCESDKEYHHVLPYLETDEYPYGPLESKVRVLQFLVDLFLTTNIARDELMSDGVMQYDDHCRVCHRLGDLLCCETCSAVYHLECVKPPLEAVPEDEWQCEVCVAHKVPGVTDCVMEVQKNKPYIRLEPIGYDRHQRKYWFLNRRIIVEEDGQCDGKRTWYYSTRPQLEELMELLDQEYWEADLYAGLEEIKEEVVAHMDITHDLTKKASSSRSYLSALNGKTTCTAITVRMAQASTRPSNVKIKEMCANVVNMCVYVLDRGFVIMHLSSLYPNSLLPTLQPLLCSLLFKSDPALKTQMNNFFKLGQEGKYRVYQNQYSTNLLALNKHQHREDYDKRRHLSHKFSLTTAAEFKWNGNIHGSRSITVGTLRLNIIQLETSVPGPFMHPNWALTVTHPPSQVTRDTPWASHR
uniref:Bromodomain PHD finger transcription factor n=1 Tax=Neogobius melanostomus TaxID=47308 RepID=A0A8C6V869_9GOBI